MVFGASIRRFIENHLGKFAVIFLALLLGGVFILPLSRPITMMISISLACLTIFAGLAALIAAYFAEYVGGLEPCLLCLYQRLPYGVNIFLGAATIILIRRGYNPAIPLTLIGGIFALGASAAFYHVGIEQGWFEGLAACVAANGETPATVRELMAGLRDQPSSSPCDRVRWSLFGISMAGYNVLYGVLMTAIILIGVVTLHGKGQGK